MHGRAMPDVDESGRPVLPPRSRFQPRNTVDLLQPMLVLWKKRFLPFLEGDGSLKILVLDGSGRFASHMQEHFPQAQVVAIDDPPRFCQVPLRLFRDGCRFPVRAEGSMDRASGALRFADGSFDVVVLPFVFSRLCSRDEPRLLALLREALRVSRQQVLFAEDVGPPSADEATFRSWKTLLQAEWRAPVLLDADLNDCAVPDHFLGAPLGARPEEAGAAGARRCLVVDASAYAAIGVSEQRAVLRSAGPSDGVRS